MKLELPVSLRSIHFERLTPLRLVAATVLALLGVAATWEAWADIFRYAWRDEEYSHIFIVPAVAAWMVWVRRSRLRHCRPSGTILGPILAGIGWWMSWYGFNHAVQVFWHAGAALVVIGCILSVLGKNVLFRFFPAFALVIFLVPMPGQIRQSIAVPLQSWTAEMAQLLLGLFGIATERSGNVLFINGKPVTIAEACNGMRMVFPLLLVAYAFCFGLPLRNSVRFLLLLLSPIAAIACNVLRTLPLVWLYGNASTADADRFHSWSGWAMLPIAFVILLGAIRLLRWMMIPVKRYTLAAQ